MKNNISSFCLFMVLILLVSVNALPQNNPGIKSGPYISCVTQTSIIIAWQTYDSSSSALEYGFTESYGSEVTDTNKVTIHGIELTDLTPSTLYHYRVKSGGTVNEDNIFQTAVKEDEDFIFVAYGDTRTNNNDHQSVVDRIITLDPKLILNTGDLVEFGRLQSQWDIYFDTIKNLAKNTPIYVSIGNHEEEHPLYYEQHFLPHNNPDSTEEYYSFDYGRCHFIALNTNLSVPYEPGSDQYIWLENDLHTNSSASYIIVFFHHPPYSSDSGHGSSMKVRSALSLLFEQYGVDIVFNGHAHIYERTYPINGVTYVVTGGGGAPLADIGPTQSWSAHTEKTLHCIKVMVTEQSIKFWMVRPDSSVGDSAFVLGPNATLVRDVDEQHDFDSITLTAYYMDDWNGNGNVTLKHKLSSENVWTFDGNMNKMDKYYIFTISELIPEMTYDIKVAYHDPDGVRGDSVQILSGIHMLPIMTRISTVWATTTYEEIQVRAFYLGDANENNSASLKYKFSSGTDWLDCGSMVKDLVYSCYSEVISDIIVGQSYDIQVSFSDPDGIAGNGVQTINNLRILEPTLSPHFSPIVVDGNVTDWLTVAPTAVDTLVIDQINGELLWQDALDDDLGDGGDAPMASDNPAPYSYPSIAVIHGAEADIEQFRMAYDNEYFYFLVDLADSISHPQLPLSIILIDTDGPTHGKTTVDYSVEVSLGDLHAWDFELALTNNNIRITNSYGDDITGEAVMSQNLNDNLFEVCVPISVLGKPEGFWSVTLLQTLNLDIYGNYGAIEIKYSAETLQGGGGIDGETDPDVYDIIGVKYSQQCADLNNYTDSTLTVIRHSWLDFAFSYSVIPDTTAIWVYPGDTDNNGTPEVFFLYQNYPNPFNPITNIQFKLPQDELVSLTIYNLLGNVVGELIEEQPYKAGIHTFQLDGNQYASGLYFYRLQAGELTAIRKMIFIK